MTIPGFSAEVSIYQSTATYFTGSFGSSANGIAVEQAALDNCVLRHLAQDESLAEAYSVCSGFPPPSSEFFGGGGDGGDGGEGVVDWGWGVPSCNWSCSPCRLDDQSATGVSKYCVGHDCQGYITPCEYDENEQAWI